MTKQEFKKRAQEKILILDGATGSNLLKRGMPHGVCTELWVTEHREVMLKLQREYMEAGSDILYAPTFSGNRIKLKEYGLLDRMEELNHTLVGISREAAGGQALVAGDITMTGAQLAPMGDLTFEELVDIYKEQISLIAEAGADLLVVETMMSLQETRAAVLAAREVCSLPVMATLSFQENGRTLYGASAKAAAVVLGALGVDAVGLNCSAGPDKMRSVVAEMRGYTDLPVIAKPNAGMPKLEKDGSTGYDMSPEEFAGYMEELLEAGADIVGGCCGSTPEFIARLRETVVRYEKNNPGSHLPAAGEERTDPGSHLPDAGEEGSDPGKPAAGYDSITVDCPKKIYLASEREVYSFAPGQKLVVGEDIDFSRNEELVEDYRSDCFDTAVDLAFDMEEAADILRIAAAAEGVDEKEALLALAEELSRNVNLPLMLAPTSPETVEYVLRHFSGIMAIQWSHNLKEWETQIKSIAKSYGAPLVTIDNEIIYC